MELIPTTYEAIADLINRKGNRDKCIIAIDSFMKSPHSIVEVKFRDGEYKKPVYAANSLNSCIGCGKYRGKVKASCLNGRVFLRKVNEE